METPTELPDFLQSSPTVTTTATTTISEADELVIEQQSRLARLDLEQTVFEIAFNHVLDELACATRLEEICTEYHTQLNPKRLLAWILRDPARAKAYHLAVEVGTEALEDEMLRIADAEGSLEDVTRSKLKIDTRWRVMKARNPKRYSDSKDVGPPPVPQISINIGQVESPYAMIEDGEVVNG